MLLGLFELSLSSLLELFSSTTFLPILLSLPLFGSSLLTRDADFAFGFPGAFSMLWLLLLSQPTRSTELSLLFASSFFLLCRTGAKCKALLLHLDLFQFWWILHWLLLPFGLLLLVPPGGIWSFPGPLPFPFSSAFFFFASSSALLARASLSCPDCLSHFTMALCSPFSLNFSCLDLLQVPAPVGLPLLFHGIPFIKGI